MPLYHLKARDDADIHAWAVANKTWYCSVYHLQGFVIRANSEVEARVLASCHQEQDAPARWWLHTDLTSCTELESHGPQAVILADTPTG